MQASATDFEEEIQPAQAVAKAVNPSREDAYWQAAFRGERYYTPGLDYEDYAPAYCVGYVGFAQYGGSFEEAEKSLCANWERIKGDSRLSLDAALGAMSAAWKRMAEREARASARSSVAKRLLRLRFRMPSLKLHPVTLR